MRSRNLKHADPQIPKFLRRYVATLSSQINESELDNIEKLARRRDGEESFTRMRTTGRTPESPYPISAKLDAICYDASKRKTTPHLSPDLFAIRHFVEDQQSVPTKEYDLNISSYGYHSVLLKAVCISGSYSVFGMNANLCWFTLN